MVFPSKRNTAIPRVTLQHGMGRAVKVLWFQLQHLRSLVGSGTHRVLDLEGPD